MVEGEFESMSMLYKVSPDLVPKPIGFGTFESIEDVHFFLCEFVDIYDEVPDVTDLCTRIADLHVRSQALSNGKFGFKVTTCNGTVQQYTRWTSSWEEFFIETLREAFELEERVHGYSQKIADMLPALYEKVCPRLLRPLETEGRILRPTLVHGDLWHGNTAIHTESGMPCIYDSSALWAHNEYELHDWRGARFRIGKTFTKEYFHHFPISAPEDDWDDRNLLYSLIADLHDSILFKGTENFRNLCIETLAVLVAKFPNGYEGDAERKSDDDLAALPTRQGQEREVNVREILRKSEEENISWGLHGQ